MPRLPADEDYARALLSIFSASGLRPLQSLGLDEVRAMFLDRNMGREFDFDAALDGAQVVMMLRLQQERMQGQFIPSPREYRHLYGLTLDRLAKARPEALVMHPGPMNRGIEIDSYVADLAGRSMITRQVEMGVAIRMACLDVLTRTARGLEGWQ